MRTALLRTAIVTAALSGAMLVPAAGAAFAAPAPAAATAKAAASEPTKVALGDNLVAHMVNSVTEAPSVTIHVVDKDGTTHPQALVSLNRAHTTESKQGTVFALTKADTAEPVLTVTANGATRSFPLPKGKAVPAPSDNSRYEGRPVYVGNGMVAVLRNKSEGPEAWIRYVGTDWKPGDDYMTHVVALVNREQTSDKAYGASFRLTGAQTTAPVLVVTTGGVAKSYPLPEGKAGQVCSSEVTSQDMGAGMSADLSMSPDGPRVALWTSGDDTTPWRLLNRGFPQLPESAGIIARIVNPGSAEPVFEWKTQGGPMPLGRASFPALPKGCKLNHKVTEPAPTTTAGTTAGTTAAPAPKPQTAGQTSVVPKGGVAAGAEIAAEDTDNSTTVLAGTGLAAVFAALGASVLLRRRRAQR
ncbi:hypothetical protein OG444_24085 [Streptomyces sp. NBC_01232]|uniref:hypothetical protein n=1 Tax=Streptomyces sp. NBC_01232 TaxID=2903786 RepID=UPI002E119017|nr:hypothetical protein OG444_24085 [Streptomyces sp. NBC_01232]